MKFQSSNDRTERFEEMALAPALLPSLEKMAITRPTDVQAQTIPVVLKGQNLIAVAQTGSGKTLAYALSLLTRLDREPSMRALVLAPSREMAQQIHDVFEGLCAGLAVSTCLVIGGQTGSKQSSRLKKNPRVIVATPGRMNDHLATNKLLLQNVRVVVIDEADRMLDMGFAPQLKSIQATMRGEWQTLMFSASFGPAVESVASLFMRSEPVMVRALKAETPVASLRQVVVFLDQSQKNARLHDELKATEGGVIVFTCNQPSCEQVGRFLKSNGHSTDLIHGGLSQGHRNRVMREFRDGDIRIVVATDLLARGLDVPHVECVVNFDLPVQSEDFLHRIGRTARAGRSGTAITFVTPTDGRMYARLSSCFEGAQEVRLDGRAPGLGRGRSERVKK